ncbi:hypothetical protein PIB30_070041 [Stylosanthes scabra]|uniref:Uncharacterized protein n=1 Tax=Stylosanthes scabra TaxID=79078 RepID=A0ABU6RNR6_9FABA|nr:hypothetical protein [Stylosanthes scabra]
MTGSLPEMDKRTVSPLRISSGCGQQPTHELMTCTRKRHASFCLRIMIMGTRGIFYEEIADDIVQTWELFDTMFTERLCIRVYPTQLPFRYPLQSFLFDPDRPYDLPISTFHP